MKMDILFRSCTHIGNGNRGKRPFNATKADIVFASLQSLVNSAVNQDCLIHVLDDHSSEKDVEILKNIIGEKHKFISLPNFGNNASFLYTIEYAKENCFDLIYFCEDDYLHFSNAISLMINFYKNSKEECIIHPTDYIDRYDKLYPSLIVLGKDRHWRTIEHTTGTFLISRDILINYWENYVKFGDTMKENISINLIYKKVRCYSPIPSLAAHLSPTPLRLPPFIDWEEEYKKSIASVYVMQTLPETDILNFVNLEEDNKKTTVSAINYNIKIPKIIHQTWKVKDVPNDIYPKEWIDTWKKLHPDWEYKLWTDEDNRNLIKDYYSWFLPIYDEYNEGIKRADVIRCFILHRYGGVYVDLDLECLKNIEPLLDNVDCFMSTEPLDFMPHHYCNMFMGSVPNHDFWTRAFEQLVKDYKKDNNIIKRNVLEVTGPKFFNRVFRNFNNKDVTLLKSNIVLWPRESYITCWIDWRKIKSFADNNKFSNNVYGVHHTVSVYAHHKKKYSFENIILLNDKNENNIYKKHNINMKQNLNIAILGLFRNSEKTIFSFFRCCDKLKKFNKNVKFSYFFYENDSIDNTKNILERWCKINNAYFLSEKLNYPTFELASRKIQRTKCMAIYRNKLKKLLDDTKQNFDWVLLVDTDIIFKYDVINQFFEYENDNIAMYTPNVKQFHKCLCCNKSSYYDTFALKDVNNNGGIDYKCNPFMREDDKIQWKNNNPVIVNSAFGGVALVKYEAFKNADWSVDITGGCEHWNFCKKIQKYGDIVVIPTIEVFTKNP